VEELGWGDAGLAVSLGVGGFPLMMAKRAGNAELVELHTGDIGFPDHEGYLHITDRMKDVIITGGFNVYPGEVEQVIWSHPAVQECAVIGLPDDEWGEAVTAAVELKAGAQLTAEELLGYCRVRLSGVTTHPRASCSWRRCRARQREDPQSRTTRAVLEWP
jgi:acyl-CoA synthetase (AMP-forming)/AMP-acid ligase II